MTFTGMRQKLKNLIILLHKEQHSDQGNNDVANDRAEEVYAQPNSRRAPSEEIQEVSHEGGGPCPVERSTAMKESGLRPRVPQTPMELANSIQSQGLVAERRGGKSTGIIQRRRFTPGPTISSHFSHVEIPNKARASSPASLQSSSSSLGSTSTTKGPWHAPARAQKSPSVSENDDYAMSIDQSFGATVSTEL